MNAREQLLTEAAALLQAVIDRDLWVGHPMRFQLRCKFCGVLSEFGEDDKDTIVHAPDCELARIQGWLAAWETMK
jgi:hypothetical protein